MSPYLNRKYLNKASDFLVVLTAVTHPKVCTKPRKEEKLKSDMYINRFRIWKKKKKTWTNFAGREWTLAMILIQKQVKDYLHRTMKGKSTPSTVDEVLHCDQGIQLDFLHPLTLLTSWAVAAAANWIYECQKDDSLTSLHQNEMFCFNFGK